MCYSSPQKAMETILVVLMCIALMVFGVMTLGQGFLVSTDSAALSTEDITVARGETLRTDISIIAGSSTGADTIELILENTGQVKLASFSKWDVIIEYHDDGDDYYIKWLDYTDGSLGADEWHYEGIYLDASANTTEAFEPEILNPEEEIKIEAKLDPPPQSGTTVDAVIATPNGISSTYSLVY